MEISPVTVLSAVCGLAMRIVLGAPRDLPEPLKQKIRAAFAGMKEIPWSKGTMIRRWGPATDANFDGVRESAKLRNLDLRKMQ